MKLVTRILNELFDFFCGDWRIFWGIAATISVLLAIEHVSQLSAFKPAAGVVFLVGVSLSLVVALKREFTE